MHSPVAVHCNENRLFAFKQLNQADKNEIKRLRVWKIIISLRYEY